MKTLTKLLLLLTIIMVTTSCDILKESQKTKNNVQSTESIKTQVRRPGDTLTIQIPKVTYRDTTIVKTNYINRTEARITYDKQGNASVDCISAEINELREEMRTLNDTSKVKESSKEESFQSEIIIYIMLGIAVIVLGAFALLLWQLNKQGSALRAVLERL